MKNKALVEKAETLAKTYNLDILQEASEMFEKLIHAYSQSGFTEDAQVALELLKEYQMAISMKELEWSEDWKNYDFNMFPIVPDYEN